MNKKDFQLSVSEIRQKYQVNSIDEGLDEEQARQLLDKYGYNQLTANKTSKWRILLRQFHNTIIYILMFSAFLTLLMGHYSDAIIIGIVVVVNALIGYFQEANASDALERIKEMLSAEATVYRNRVRQDIPAENLVPGDIVFLEAGDNVPADLRIVEADNLRIQESALTGETDSVEKAVDLVADEAPP